MIGTDGNRVGDSYRLITTLLDHDRCPATTLLTLYQLLRIAMVTAVETRPGTDPDRASFTTALETARDQLTAANGVCPR